MRVLPLLPLVVLAAALPSCGGGSVSAAERPRPDVLLLLIDTLRADRLGCYGYPRDTSPTLDEVAARGVLCTNASAQAPWTIPSVSSLMTGRYLTAHQERPAPEAPTLAEIFHDAGYDTLGVVANNVILPDVGFERGFDTFVTRHYRDEKGRRRRHKEGPYDVVQEWARPHLEAHAAQAERPPLFFYLHVIDPHDVYEPHPDLADELPHATVPPVEPVGWWEDTLAAIGPPAPEDDPGWARELARMQRGRGNYDREIRFTDAHFAETLAELEALGIGENLLVAVVSDHGEELWEHLAPYPPEEQRRTNPERLFFQTHGYVMTEPSLRTPFLLAGPGVPEGVVLDAPVENIDLYPTLLELCDLGVDFETHGRSLVPLFGGEAPERDATFSYVQHAMAVREEATGLKLVLPTEHGLKLGVTPTLHDLSVDPHERVDLFEQRPDDVARLTERAMRFLREFPAEEQVVEGEAAAQLLEALESFGYAGDMIRGGQDEAPPTAPTAPDGQ